VNNIDKFKNHDQCSRCRRSGNCKKIRRNQRSAADQTAIDIRQVEQGPRVGRFDATAIKNQQRIRNSSIPRAHFATNKGMGLLHLLRAGGPPGTNRPARLVCHYQPAQHLVAEQLEYRLKLPCKRPLGLPGIALMQRLAHTQHRNQARSLRHKHFLRDQLIALTVVLAPLGMPNQHVAATNIRQHHRRHLAGKGTLLVAADILRTKTQAAVRVAGNQFREVRQRRKYRQISAVWPATSEQRIEQLDRELPISVQLPVGSNETLAHKPAQCSQ